MIGNLSAANNAEADRLLELAASRENERLSAIAENNRYRDISPESREALARGDRQRETGVYEDSISEVIDEVIWNDSYYYDLDRLADDGGPHHG